MIPRDKMIALFRFAAEQEVRVTLDSPDAARRAAKRMRDFRKNMEKGEQREAFYRITVRSKAKVVYLLVRQDKIADAVEKALGREHARNTQG